jgi:hypothetical protein
VLGAAFVPKSQILWNGTALPTTYKSAGKLTASVAASLLATGGVAQVNVFNPAPGGGNSNAVNFTITNPLPTLTSITPNQATAGSSNLSLILVGANFIPGSNGSIANWTVGATTTALATTFVSATKLTAIVPANLLSAAGTAGVSVTNPAPGGGSSASLPFTINPAGNPAPTIEGISPSAEPAGSSRFIMEVIGSNFVTSSVIEWNGSPLPTGYSNPNTLTATVDGSLITTPGTAQITVFTPAPGGGLSNAVVFNIIPPGSSAPSISNLIPSQALVNSGAFVMTILGANFLTNSTVNFGSAALTPTSVNSVGTVITVSVPASLLTTAQIVNVTVTNPAPGGGTSNALPFAIANPVPVILAAPSPSQAPVNSGSFVLKLTGSGFAASATVNFGNTSLTPDSVSQDGSTIHVTIPGSLLTTAANVSITVTNPAPGGGTSNAVGFIIANSLPSIASLNPNQAQVSSGGFTLTVTGSNFVAGSVVNWQPTVSAAPAALTPFYVSADGKTLKVNIDASLIDVPAQTVNVSVTNPMPGEGPPTCLCSLSSRSDERDAFKS